MNEAVRRIVEEKAAMYDRMADHANGIGAYRAAEFYARKAIALRKELA